MSNDKIERQIQEIEEKLKDLKLALRNRSSEQKPKKPQKAKHWYPEVGDWVRITNPAKGQAEEGIITKANPKSGRATVKTTADKPIWRAWKNLVNQDPPK